MSWSATPGPWRQRLNSTTEELAWRDQHPVLVWIEDRLALRESFKATLPVAQGIAEWGM